MNASIEQVSSSLPSLTLPILKYSHAQNTSIEEKTIDWSHHAYTNMTVELQPQYGPLGRVLQYCLTVARSNDVMVRST